MLCLCFLTNGAENQYTSIHFHQKSRLCFDCVYCGLSVCEGLLKIVADNLRETKGNWYGLWYMLGYK